MSLKISLPISYEFGSDINTDDIIPAPHTHESTKRKFFAEKAFSVYAPDFVEKVTNFESSAIIAGKNFGTGSSREQAVYAIQENGVRAVIAESFPDIFYRNALNNGLILISLESTSHFKVGSEVTIDLYSKKLIYRDFEHVFEMRETDRKIFSAGGKTSLVKNYLHSLLLGEKERPKHYIEFSSQIQNPKTIVEKIVSSHLHKEVSVGDNLEDVPIDTLYVSDAFGPAVIEEFQNNFDDVYEEYDVSNKVFDSERVFLIVDHDSPPSSPKSCEGIRIMRDFSKEQDLKFYKPGDGIEHVVLMEDGYIAPGSIVVATDSHTCTNGALNALSFGIGTTEATYTLSTGFLHYFTVPETIRINLSGQLQKGVYAKDFILYLLGSLSVRGATGKILEFGGEGISNLSIESRATISNMTVEMGARGSLFEYDVVTESYLKDRAKVRHKHFNPDEGCNYSEIIDIDLSDLEPCVAFPHKPDNVTFISQIEEYMEESRAIDSVSFPAINSLKITHGFLGACTNGKYEDFVEAAKIIKGHKVPENVDFVVIPASRKIYNQLLKEGVLEIFAEAGANIESSTCGPCYGRHKGVLGSQSQIISSSNRNFIGRMGSKGSKIFLASPATVTASVLEGKITDPRKYLL